MSRKPENPQNGENVRGFQVRTPICHIVPVSRACPKALSDFFKLFQGFGPNGPIAGLKLNS